MSRDLCVLITAEFQIFLCFCLFKGLFLRRIIACAASTAWWILLAIGQDRPSPTVPLNPPKGPLLSLHLLVKMLRSISAGLFGQGEAQGLCASVSVVVVAKHRALGNTVGWWWCNACSWPTNHARGWPWGWPTLFCLGFATQGAFGELYLSTQGLTHQCSVLLPLVQGMPKGLQQHLLAAFLQRSSSTAISPWARRKIAGRGGQWGLETSGTGW